MSKKQKTNLSKKIEVIEDFINRRAVGTVLSIGIAHLQNFKTVKKPNQEHLDALKKCMESWLLTTEKNNARRETEMDAFKNAEHII